MGREMQWAGKCIGQGNVMGREMQGSKKSSTNAQSTLTGNDHKHIFVPCQGRSSGCERCPCARSRWISSWAGCWHRCDPTALLPSRGLAARTVPACSGQCVDPGHMPHVPPQPEHRLGRKDLLLVEAVGSEEGNQHRPEQAGQGWAEPRQRPKGYRISLFTK